MGFLGNIEQCGEKKEQIRNTLTITGHHHITSRELSKYSHVTENGYRQSSKVQLVLDSDQ